MEKRNYDHLVRERMLFLKYLEIGSKVKNSVTGEVGNYMGIKDFDEETDRLVGRWGIPAVHLWVMVEDHLTSWTLNMIEIDQTHKKDHLIQEGHLAIILKKLIDKMFPVQ